MCELSITLSVRCNLEKIINKIWPWVSQKKVSHPMTPLPYETIILEVLKPEDLQERLLKTVPKESWKDMEVPFITDNTCTCYTSKFAKFLLQISLGDGIAKSCNEQILSRLTQSSLPVGRWWPMSSWWTMPMAWWGWSAPRWMPSTTSKQTEENKLEGRKHNRWTQSKYNISTSKTKILSRTHGQTASNYKHEPGAII